MAGYTNLNARLARLEAAAPAEGDLIVRRIIVPAGEPVPSHDEAVSAMIASGELDQSERDRVSLIVVTARASDD